ncbi:STAS domain-containing protein [Arthrobacter sp. ISL-72]|uniref:STAS domain-containing protein n=1 Tax=Arthrobacter sp. ISL-72 TaxID=2819114 RepID=UPI001BE73014|nr:STAS domain-containing protein [Arthrobacter sp. ISL-72]MBT2594951.1 STAS domain-containing protein [Arthrobacter sp. ISL-72]
MQFNYELKDSYTEVKGSGRLNMMAAPKLREVVAEVVAPGSNRVVVNLEETMFIDSSGLGALIGCPKAARQAGGDLRISGVQPQVRMVLELTNMGWVLTPYPTAEAAFGHD